MKTRIFLAIVSACLVWSVQAQSVKISGSVSDEINSVTLKAFNPKSLAYDEISNVKTKNGAYQLRYKYDQSNLYQLSFGGKKSVRISITNERAIEVSFLNDQVEIKGSPESEAMQLFQSESDEREERHFAQLKKDADKAMASGDQDAMKLIQQRSAEAIQKFLPELREWIISKGEGPAGYYAVQFSDFNKELAFIETRLAAFQEKNPDQPVTKALARQVYRSKVVSIGKRPPAIEAVDREGKAFDLQQYQGKILLIDFWAAWCRACRIENPQFVELHKKYNDQGFEVVSISQDATKKAWNQAIAKDGVDIWRHIWDKDEVITELYSVGSLPQNVVLGRDGKIIGKNVNAEKLQALLSKSL